MPSSPSRSPSPPPLHAHHAQELLDADADHKAQQESLKKEQRKEKNALKSSHRLQVLQSSATIVNRSKQAEEHLLNNQVVVMGKLLRDLLLFLAENMWKRLRPKTCPRRLTVKTFLSPEIQKALLLFAKLKGLFSFFFSCLKLPFMPFFEYFRRSQSSKRGRIGVGRRSQGSFPPKEAQRKLPQADPLVRMLVYLGHLEYASCI